MLYQLQYLKADGDWHTVEASGDLGYLSRRRQAFRIHCNFTEDRVRIVDASPPSEVPFLEREASGVLTFITLALLVALIAVIGLSVS